MRIARVQHEGTVRTATVAGDAVRILPKSVEVTDLLAADAEGRARLEASAETEQTLLDTQLLAPIQPTTIRDFTVFERHVEGAGMNFNPEATVPDVWYESPFCYFSNTNVITGPGDEIAVPPGCVDLDLELEVAAVIGRSGTNLAPGEAGDYIAGYTIYNDWSARDLIKFEIRLGLGLCKGKDFSNTFGPWIVTADELEPYRSGDRLELGMRATINGEELGKDTLTSMAWSFEELVSYASRGSWVRPGDVLGTGTCADGCLFEFWGRNGRDSRPALAPGDTVTLEVEGIGELTNTIVAGVDPIELPRARV